MEIRPEDQIASLKQLVENRIHSLDFDQQPSNLYDPIKYILTLGGKRLRPTLTLLGFSLFNNNPESFIDPAVAVEVFHNFTLIHDDIMDKAPLRRGQATVHKKWREETAILAGDVMLVLAYQLIINTGNTGNTGFQKQKVLEAFNQCALGVCEGQQMDIDFENTGASIADYLEMIRLKTAVLLGFCMELGALGGMAEAEDIRLARLFGEHLGMAFQLQDDFLDVYGESEKVGKQVCGDILANKKTFLWIKAYDLSNTSQKAELDEWIKRKSFDPDEKIQSVKNIYNQVKVLDHTKKEMNSHFEKASNALGQINVPENRKIPLTVFYQKLISRDK